MFNVNNSVLTEKQILNSPEKCNKTNLEHICMDILDNVNNIEELQFKQNNTKSLAKLYLESFVKEITEGRIVVGNMIFTFKLIVIFILVFTIKCNFGPILRKFRYFP